MPVTSFVRARHVLVAVALALTAGVLRVAPAAASEPGTASTRVIVTFRDRSSALAMTRARAATSSLDATARVVRSYGTVPVVAMDASPDAVRALAARPDVESVVPDRRLTTGEPATASLPAPLTPSTVSSDGADLPVATGEGWTVAIVDTGVDTSHPYIAGRTSRGADGLGDAGACFADDCPGAAPGQAAFGVAAAQPCAVGGCEHGTHVAGIAVGDPSKVSTPGLNGMAPGAGLYPERVFSTSSDPAVCGSTRSCATAWESDVLAALDHLATEAGHYRFAAVNMSLGDGDTYAAPCSGVNAPIEAAIGTLHALGIAVVASAGNHGSSAAVSFPACVDGAIAVAAQDASGNIASFSDTSPKVALAAPGTDILSSLPGGGFGRKSGTSMSAPAVSGALALVHQAAPAMSAAALLDVLRSTGSAANDFRSGASYRALNPDAALASLGYRRPGSAIPAARAFRGLAAPQRIVDTRAGVGGGRLAAGATLVVNVTGVASTPTEDGAASLNVTAVDAAEPGFLTVFPCNQPRPVVSSVNYAGPAPVANKVVAEVPTDGRVCIYTMSATDVVVDVDGYLQPGSPFHALTPRRALDTRPGLTPTTDVAVAAVPAGSAGAVANVTITEPQAAGFATVFPCGQAPPLASNLNFTANETVPGAALVPVDSMGRVCVHTSSPAHVIVDVAGWLGPGFTPVVPFRVVDTRSQGAPVNDVLVAPGLAGTALAMTLTVTGPTAAGYATVYPCGQPPPLASNINFVAGETVANAVIATPDSLGHICVHAPVPTHLIVDVSGSFA